MSAPTTAPQACWLNLPDGWIVLDLRGKGMPTQLREAFDEREAASPEFARSRKQVEQQILTALRGAKGFPISLAAIFLALSVEGAPIAASLAITHHDAPTATDADQLLHSLGEQGNKQNTLIRLAFVDQIVRSQFTDTVSSSDGQGRSATADVVIFQYFIPVPGKHEVIVATFSTPTIPMAEFFGELFDAIMTTFQFIDGTPETTDNG